MQNEPKVPPGVRVLLVEDEPLIALHCEDALRALGVANVVCARSVSEAIAALDQGPFHAAILDQLLGSASSLPIAHLLADLGIPFGFLTGYSDRSIAGEFKDRPYLAKPFTREQLEQLLIRLVG